MRQRKVAVVLSLKASYDSIEDPMAMLGYVPRSASDCQRSAKSGVFIAVEKLVGLSLRA